MYKKKATEEAEHALQLQAELEKIKREAPPPPRMAKEEIAELLKESPLSSKLEEVEALLRQLLAERETAKPATPAKPETAKSGTGAKKKK